MFHPIESLIQTARPALSPFLKAAWRGLPLLIIFLMASCSRPKAEIPAESKDAGGEVQIYPDYKGVTIPPNIAPLNFQVKSEGEEYVASVEGGGRQLLAAAGEDGKMDFDSLQWHSLLQAARGKQLTVTLYARRGGEWLKFPAYKMDVAAEEIDRYLSYRLIEPSYELYRQLGLYQRDLTNFSQTAIYENNREYDDGENHCINCHTYQNHSTRRMLFHVRAKHGGTVFIQDEKAEKFDMKCDSILSSAVYPSWHPREPWVIFSSNQTGQAFHMINRQKIEVVDYGSDLIFFDVAQHKLYNVLKTDGDLETFPTWSPDGRKVFYCSAHVSEFVGKNADQRRDIITNICTKVRYNLMSLTFDPATRRFGPPVLELDCAAQGKSAAVPRVSPDGRYLLFTLASYGQFHIWHDDADLYIKDLQTGSVSPLTEANAPGADSFHDWSGNGRWIIFVSRRDDGSYSRVYISYFDKAGRAHKAFLLPQRDPEQNLLLAKSYNVPQLSRAAVPVSAEQLKQVIYADDKAVKVSYGGRK